MRMISFVALLFAGAATAATPFTPKMAEAFRKQYPTIKIQPDEVAVGDLNKDGLADFATFVGDANDFDDLPIAVFLAKADGSYAMHTESGPVLGHSRSQRGLEVQKHSLFLRRSGSDGCCADWAEKFQFQLRDGVFVLAGEDNYLFPKGDSDDERQTSVNYLTREALFWRKLHGKRKEKRLSFEMPALMTLKSFDYSAHYTEMPKVLQSNFDAQLHFVESK